LITGSNKAKIAHVKRHLEQCFGIKDLGSLHYFLGLEVSHLPEGIVLSQDKFTQQLLQDAAISSLQAVATPLPINCKLTAIEGPLIADPSHYRVMMGKLNFLTNTRPNLSFAVQTLSQFMQDPHTPHLHALTYILRYLKGTVRQGILLKARNKVQFSNLPMRLSIKQCPKLLQKLLG